MRSGAVRNVLAATAAALAALPATAGAVDPTETPVTFNADWEASAGVLPEASCPPWTAENNTGELPTFPSGLGTMVISTDQNADIVAWSQSGDLFMLPDPLVIEARVKFDSGMTSSDSRSPANITFSTMPDFGNALHIRADQVFINSAHTTRGATANVDTNDAFHNYRIEVTTAGAINVFRDDAFLFSGTEHSGNYGGPQVIWGEGSILAYGASEWAVVRDNASAVDCTPEPPGAPPAPETLITKGPKGNTEDRTPEFGFRSPTAGATFECAFDKKRFNRCTSPHAPQKKLGFSKHAFRVRAVNAAGVPDPTPAQRGFRIVRK